jgi:hypothetical protein
MANVDFTNDGLVGLDYDSQGQPSYLQRSAWNFNSMDPTGTSQRSGIRRPVTPLQTSGQGFEHTPALSSNLMNDWQYQQTFSQMHYSQDATTSGQQYNGLYNMPLHTSPTDLITTTQAPLNTSSLQLDESYLPLNGEVSYTNWQDFQTNLNHFVNAGGLPEMSMGAQALVESSSPTDTCGTYLESRSLPSSGSDSGWTYLDNHRHTMETFHDHGRFVNPSQTLHDHHRAFSQSSESDYDVNARASFVGSLGSFVEIPTNIHSPSTDSNTDFELLQAHFRSSTDPDSRPSTAVSPNTMAISPNPMAVSPSTMAITPNPMPLSPIVTRPIPIKKASSPIRSPASSNSASSPPARNKSKKSPVAKSPIAKSPIAKVEKSNRKQSQVAKPETEKRVGKRKGPLRPDQRKQASEIRKLRACLRCKFLKKTVCYLSSSLPLILIACSATKVSHVQVVNLRTLDCGRFLAPG